MRQLRQSLKALSRAMSHLLPQGERDVVILMYHRVIGDSGLELDIRFDDFEEQMCWLAKHANVAALRDAIEAAATEADSPVVEPRFVLTFDDAFEDFFTHALPVLRNFGLPATLYVPTGFVEDSRWVPVSRSAKRGSALAPMTWGMLEDVAEDDLITIGAHTHGHWELPVLSDERVEEELLRCDNVLLERLGVRAKDFAYPRGAWDERVERFVRKRYRSAVHVGGGAVDYSRLDRYRLPRIPVLASDRVTWFESRIGGHLRYEESAVRNIKRLGRFSKNAVGIR